MIVTLRTATHSGGICLPEAQERVIQNHISGTNYKGYHTDVLLLMTLYMDGLILVLNFRADPEWL